MAKIKFFPKLLLLLVLVPVSLLSINFTLLNQGFCYKEMSFLSKREMLDRVIFGQDFMQISENEKSEILSRRNYLGYPNNCRFTKKGVGVSEFDHFMWSLVGKKLFSIECLSHRDPEQYSDDPYYVSNFYIKSCGAQGDGAGMSVTERVFNALMERNRNYWEGKSQ